ncbi:MAG: hypothetical protein ACMG6S_10725, partial [Byssovorax sp.]
MPVLGDRLLGLRHGGAGETNVLVSPALLVDTVTQPVVPDPEAARDGDLSIEHHDLAVIAGELVVAWQRAKDAHLAAGLHERGLNRLCEVGAPEIIHE